MSGYYKKKLRRAKIGSASIVDIQTLLPEAHATNVPKGEMGERRMEVHKQRMDISGDIKEACARDSIMSTTTNQENQTNYH